MTWPCTASYPRASRAVSTAGAAAMASSTGAIGRGHRRRCRASWRARRPGRAAGIGGGGRQSAHRIVVHVHRWPGYLVKFGPARRPCDGAVGLASDMFDRLVGRRSPAKMVGRPGRRGDGAAHRAGFALLVSCAAARAAPLRLRRISGVYFLRYYR